MNPVFNEWLELILRWAHVFAGIMWVGATFYFTWLDGRFTELEENAAKNPDEKNPEKFVWMVHSGGFYLVEKQKNPKLMTQTLHWFKWEAATTWITGILLFGLLYYHRGILVNFEDEQSRASGWFFGICTLIAAYSPLVFDKVWVRGQNRSVAFRILYSSLAAIGHVVGWIGLLVIYVFLGNTFLPHSLFGFIGWFTGSATCLSVFFLIAGWLVYDTLWNSRLFANEIVGAVISFGLIVMVSWGSSHYFSARGAYMQLGAMMGTIMAANVWMRILPAQRRMVAALKAGTPPNLEEGARAKARSKHNAFIVIPVVFLMISNHYPGTYGSPKNWIILSVLVLVGWGVAKLIRGA
jgi:uncharacterized membrane protein